MAENHKLIENLNKKDKTKKIIFRIKAAIIAIAFILIIALNVVYIYNFTLDEDPVNNVTDISDNWIMLSPKTRSKHLINTTQISKFSNPKKIEIEKKITQKMIKNKSLIFLSYNQIINAFIGDRMIYNSGLFINNNHLQIKKSFGFQWNVINFPADVAVGDKITIVIKPFNKKFIHLPQIFSCDEYSFMVYLAKYYSATSVLMLFLLIITSIMAFYCFLNSGKNETFRLLFNITILSAMALLWSLLRNPIILMFLPNPVTGKIISYFLVLLMANPMLNIGQCLEDFKYKKLFTGLAIGINTYAVIKTTYFMFLSKDISPGNALDLIVGGIFLTIYMVCLIRQYMQKQSKTLIIIFSYIGVFILIFGLNYITIYNRALYYHKNIVNNAILVIILLLIFKCLSELYKTVKISRQTSYYENVSTTDIMTGLGNRLSFSIQQKIDEGMENLSIISMDLNNLKIINDTYGHSTGDRYIIEFANILKSVFTTDYETFRLGGDEFAIVSRTVTEGIMKAKIKTMYSQIEQSNKKTGFNMGVAVGLAKYEKDQDTGFISVFNRADDEMYNNKRINKLKKAKEIEEMKKKAKEMAEKRAGKK